MKRNGELRFLLGWAQEVAGNHAAARESWREARGELEPFLKEQPNNYLLLGDLALTNMVLGDGTAALALAQRAVDINPIEKDAVFGPDSVEFLARWLRARANLTALLQLYRSCSRYRMKPILLGTCRLLQRCSGSIPCSIRSGTIRASKNSARRRGCERCLQARGFFARAHFVTVLR